MSTPEALPYIEPPRIGICGGASIDSATAEFCRVLGRSLAQRQGAVLVSGGCRRRVGSENLSVDWHTVQGAVSVLQPRGEVETRIETLLPADDPLDIEKFASGRTITLAGATPQSRRFRLLASVDVLVAVAGDVGTRQHLDLALAIERPLLPVPFFGGESQRCWKGQFKPAVIKHMGLSSDDVRFLEDGFDGDRGRDPGTLQATAERVTAMLWRRLTKTCMVIMPFAKDFDPLYSTVMEPAIRDAGLFPLRTDQLKIPINIVDTINRGIEHCQCAIAVLDRLRPNVFYELGRAHAHQKPILLLVPDGTDVPFDIAGHSYVKYTMPDDGLAARIEGYLKALAGTSPSRRLAFVQ